MTSGFFLSSLICRESVGGSSMMLLRLWLTEFLRGEVCNLMDPQHLWTSWKDFVTKTWPQQLFMNSGWELQRFPREIGQHMNMNASAASWSLSSPSTSWTFVRFKEQNWWLDECRSSERPTESRHQPPTTQRQNTLRVGDGGRVLRALILHFQLMLQVNWRTKQPSARKPVKPEKTSSSPSRSWEEQPGSRRREIMRSKRSAGGCGSSGRGQWSSRKFWQFFPSCSSCVIFGNFLQFYRWMALRRIPEDGRWREVFPHTTIPHAPDVPASAGRSVSSRRRAAKVRSRVQEVNAIVDCLNEMYLPGLQAEEILRLHGPTQAHQACHRSIFQ